MSANNADTAIHSYKILKQHACNLAVLAALGLSAFQATAESGMQDLGDLGGATTSSEAYAISSDGTTVVGKGRNTSNNFEAFSWTSSGGMQGLGNLGGSSPTSEGLAVSANGSVIVGQSQSASGYEAFRWTSSGGMMGLGDLPGWNYYSKAIGVSDDGATVVGISESSNGVEAFRWTSSDGMVGLGGLGGSTFSSEAHGVSADGSVVVGKSRSATMGGGNSDEAFRWTASGGMVGLGKLTGGSTWSEARAVSDDGSVVVGDSGSALGTQAFRWTSSGGMVGLGILSGYDASYAYAVSSDGSVVVGYNENDSTDATTAIRWTETSGMQTLAEWLAEDGYTLTDWTDTAARGVNEDGSIVVGYGTNSDGNQVAFIARNDSGLIGVDDFSDSLQNTSVVTSQAVLNAGTVLHGAHGHPGANRAMNERRYFWVAGDLAEDRRHNSNDDFGLAEVGMAYRVNNAVTLSGAIGKTWNDSDLLFSGNSKGDGHYLIVDTDIRLPVPQSIYATLSLMFGESDIDIRRGYLNSGSLDSSSASTKQNTQAVRARLQWQNAWEYQQASIHSYIEYNQTQIDTDGYTESGGGFPAIYNDHSESVEDWRLGVDVDYAIDSDTKLLGGLEIVNRMNSQGKGVSGQVIGLSLFEYTGRNYSQEWLRASFGVEQGLGKGKASLMINASTQGEDPNIWVGFNYSLPF